VVEIIIWVVTTIRTFIEGRIRVSIFLSFVSQALTQTTFCHFFKRKIEQFKKKTKKKLYNSEI
jgi:hypothetical protein